MKIFKKIYCKYKLIFINIKQIINICIQIYFNFTRSKIILAINIKIIIKNKLNLSFKLDQLIKFISYSPLFKFF